MNNVSNHFFSSSFEYLSNFSLVSFCLSLQASGGAMSVQSGASVTFNGNSNVMQLNTASSGNGKSIYSSSPSLTFTDCEPGNINILSTPKTYTVTKIIEVDLEKCACTTIANKATAATVTCTSTTDSQLVGNCADGHWKDATGTADVCTGCRSACGAGTRETTPCSSAANRRCTQNTCSCSNGVKATGTTCTTHNTNICTSCSSGYTKSDNTCNANTCAPTRVANSNKAASNSIEGTISNYINICCFIL